MRIVFLILLSLSALSLTAQESYTLLLEDENIKISYQVLEVKKKGAMIPEVRLMVENKSDKAMDIQAELKFQYDFEIAEGLKIEGICVNAGKTKKGKIRGLYYNPEQLTFAQLMSGDVEFLLEEVNVNAIEKCK